MKVRYLKEWNTPFAYIRPGTVKDVPPERARALIDGGIAEAVDAPKPAKPESVTKPARK